MGAVERWRRFVPLTHVPTHALLFVPFGVEFVWWGLGM